jgi:RNA polymerase sigma-70 factor (ECF subfamily)
MDLISLDDVALIRLVARESEDALDVLYQRYHRLVYSLAFGVVGERGAAEEITLDVFTRIWQNAGRYRAERAKVSTWLTSITRNRAIDVLRRRSARPERDAVSWAEINPADHPWTNGPEPQTEQMLMMERVQSAVAQLPEEQRQVLALAYFHGLTQRGIAERLDMPLGTVKTRVRLGMAKLRLLLADG